MHECSVTSVVSNSLRPYGLRPTRILCPWDSPGKNTGVGCHALLQGIFPTQGSNLCLFTSEPPAKPKPVKQLTYNQNPIIQRVSLTVYTFSLEAHIFSYTLNRLSRKSESLPSIHFKFKVFSFKK